MKLLTTIKKEHFKELKEFLVESGFYEEGEKGYPNNQSRETLESALR